MKLPLSCDKMYECMSNFIDVIIGKDSKRRGFDFKTEDKRLYVFKCFRNCKIIDSKKCKESFEKIEEKINKLKMG